ncbi:hypothetical protein STRIP9103_02036 [Streptomyces ipomoeae 91-03]|uniref:Uncharacterized protein n=1 Tax=Streptomyces ipomoeae 91-03 TaxID=698759 RepID=L1L495_9ACTN|nr:hypothetical protein STRIP9103_02036 [Streptomyces ipomoeae 91-03]
MERGGPRPVGRCDAHRTPVVTSAGDPAGTPELPVSFYARQSPAWSGQLSRFQPWTARDRYMNWAASAEIRLG